LLSFLLFFFAFITPSEQKDDSEETEVPLNLPINEEESLKPAFSFAAFSLTTKRIIGISLSVLSGVLYGSNFTPPQYIMDNCVDNCSQNGLDYVFSHFCGIYITSTTYFLGYAALRGNRPIVYPEIVLPGFVSGLLWSTAQISWFIANSTIQIVISFPVISTLPGIVGSIWGILVFKEITGRRNFLLFGAAFFCVAACVTCVALSKEGSAHNSTLII